MSFVRNSAYLNFSYKKKIQITCINVDLYKTKRLCLMPHGPVGPIHHTLESVSGISLSPLMLEMGQERK